MDYFSKTFHQVKIGQNYRKMVSHDLIQRKLQIVSSFVINEQWESVQ